MPGIPVEDQRLFLDNAELDEDDMTLAELGVRAGATIELNPD